MRDRVGQRQFQGKSAILRRRSRTDMMPEAAAVDRSLAPLRAEKSVNNRYRTAFNPGSPGGGVP